MLTRRALIIGSPDKDIPGVKIDVENYEKFLLSPLGGSWHPNELVILENPTKTSLVGEIVKLKGVDYSMTIFAGHGEQPTRHSPIIIRINGNETSSDTLLRAGAPKHTLILDCCRLLRSEVLEEYARAKMSRQYNAVAPSTRHYYEQAILAAPKGLVVMCGCDVNETSGESSTGGGYYSSSLVQGAEQWQMNDQTDLSKYYNMLSVADAHELAKPRVKRLSAGQQNPAIEKPRSSPYFPFAINAR